MTTEQLLVPRRIVIAGWFQSNINPFQVGDILEKKGIHFTRIGSNPKSFNENEVDNFPHLIAPMHWSENRSPQDMPQYVKSNWGGNIYKIEKWSAVEGETYLVTEFQLMGSECEPATESEYKSYIASKTENK